MVKHNRTTYAEVKQACIDERFFAYNDWRDKLFVPPSFFLVWLFVKLNWSGNAVSWLSGCVTILGGILLTSRNHFLVLLGSLSYILFYYLDYVDGGVARYRKTSGIGGQYTDWIMHVISSVSISSGIFVGAFASTGSYWLVPFGLLYILASILQWDRFSMGWWSICMYRQQHQCKGIACEFTGKDAATSVKHKTRSYFFWKLIRIASTLLFHENYMIFHLPLLAVFAVVVPGHLPDFRIVLTVLGGSMYFLFVIHEIVQISSNRRLDAAYNRLFDIADKPDLPDDHFIRS